MRNRQTCRIACVTTHLYPTNIENTSMLGVCVFISISGQVRLVRKVWRKISTFQKSPQKISGTFAVICSRWMHRHVSFPTYVNPTNMRPESVMGFWHDMTDRRDSSVVHDPSFYINKILCEKLLGASLWSVERRFNVCFSCSKDASATMWAPVMLCHDEKTWGKQEIVKKLNFDEKNFQDKKVTKF